MRLTHNGWCLRNFREIRPLATALDHESRDDPVEDRAVIALFGNQTRKCATERGAFRLQGNHEVAKRCVDQDHRLPRATVRCGGSTRHQSNQASPGRNNRMTWQRFTELIRAWRSSVSGE